MDDAQYLAKRRLPRFLYEMYEAGSGAGITLRANVEAFDEVLFRPRAGVFVPLRDLRTRVIGHEVSMPVLISSVGALRIGHPDGEVGVARAVGASGTIQIVSTATGSTIEQISSAATGPVFFQLYYVGGRAGTEAIIDRAKRSGCAALVVNVDSPARAPRDRPLRNRAYVPTAINVRQILRIVPQLFSRPAWLCRFLLDGARTDMPMGLRADGSPMSILELFDAIFESAPVWEDIPWIRDQWKGPIVIKGIITPEDARRAVSVGADAIVVSNHGGNRLDGTAATLRVLPQVVQAVGTQTEVWMDGGVRRGSDVVKAVALGARAVLIGRAYVFALMAAGELGVRRILQLFREEIDQTLGFLGCSSFAELDSSHVDAPEAWFQPRSDAGSASLPR